MRGAEDDEPEMSFRRGYQQGAIEVFHAIERFLDPATREVVQAWIEKDVFMWQVKAMLAHPPNWRLNMIAGPSSPGRPLDCMSSEHFGQLAWQFKRMSGSSGLKVQAAIAC